MKKILAAAFSFVFLFPAVSASAQGKYGADSAECIKYLSYYSEYFKQKNYNEALPNWRQAYNLCPPTANQNMLINGTVLVRRLISENAKNPVYKQALIDTLMTLHDQRAEYYPKYAVTARNNKGLDMSNYIKDDDKALYNGYNAIIEANGVQTRPAILLFDLHAAIALYKTGGISMEDVMNTYQRNISLIEEIKPKNDMERDQNAKIKSDLESLFISSEVANCDELLALYSPRYEADPNNLDLVTSIASTLARTEGCTDNDLFFNAVSSMHRLNPSYTSAYYLYKLNSGRGNTDEAVKYLEEAIAHADSDVATDAEYTYELAVFCSKNGKTVKALEAANAAIALDASLSGKCYFLMGTIWGATTCGGDEISKRAPYWVAVDYLQKAKNADASLAEDANKLISQYSKYYPQTAEAFMYDLTDGKSYTVSCGGLRAVTTVRTQK